ncbi:hypothetical protein [Kitasatospora sp. NPDC001132]
MDDQMVITEDQKWAVAYAIRSTLAQLVTDITNDRKAVDSDEWASVPGVLKQSIMGGIEQKEETYRRLVETYATLPEALRPDMRNRLFVLPETDAR